MRHGKKVNHLGRTKSHRVALLSNMANSLIKTKRIETTLAKAKALRMYIEPLLTKVKTDSTHSRRIVFSYLQDKESINILFNEIAQKIAERNGGYTRIIKLGQRQGDNSHVALIELVDYNENLLTIANEEEGKAKRSRRGSKAKKSSDETEEVVAPTAVVQEEVETSAEIVEEVVAETAEVVETVEESVVVDTVTEVIEETTTPAKESDESPETDEKA